MSGFFQTWTFVFFYRNHVLTLSGSPFYSLKEVKQLDIFYIII